MKLLTPDRVLAEDAARVAVSPGSSANRAPEMEPLNDVIIGEGERLTFTVSASDPDNDDLLYNAYSPELGEFFDSTTGVFDWTPADGDNGLYDITFYAYDGQDYDLASITISVYNTITPGGIISTVAGGGETEYEYYSGSAAAVILNNIEAMSYGGDGNLYIGSCQSDTVRKIDPDGYSISTVVGSDAVNAGLQYVMGLEVDSEGNIYVSDDNYHVVIKINTDNTVETIAGGGGTFAWDYEGPATGVSFYVPEGLDTDSSGNLYITDSWHSVIRKVTFGDGQALISTVAGTGDEDGYWIDDFYGDGGPATEAALDQPKSVEVDDAGNIYIADTGNGRIRKVDLNGIITTIAGGGNETGLDFAGQATEAYLGYPTDVAVDSLGNVYIADSGNSENVIRRVNPDGYISTVAGGGEIDNPRYNGPATDVILDNPYRIEVDQDDNLYISDEANQVIRKVEFNQ